MQRKLTATTTLDNLKKEAKRWLKALRENDAAARARLEHAHPNAPGKPVLRDVQYALARVYGQNSWTELKQALETRSTPARLVTRFLEYACPDHHVRGRPAHRMARHAAMRVLQQDPQIARDSIYPAAVCGELDEVERILKASPDLANSKRSVAGPDR